MLEYSFLTSPLCQKLPQRQKQPHPLQHLLPPDTALLKQTKQSSKLQDILAKKSQQAKLLAQKNNQLVSIVNQKQNQRLKINKKYNQLMIMYEEIKNNGATLGMEIVVRDLENQNKGLIDKNRKLERELIQVEKQIVKKTKFYQDKNQDSRKLLQKLNYNITKRQQKFKAELAEAQAQIRKKNEVLAKLQQQYRYLQSMNNEKQDQLTKIMQETQRDRSAYSQNISTIQIKLQGQNQKLNEDLYTLKSQLQQLTRQSSLKIQKLTQQSSQLTHHNNRLKSQNENLYRKTQQMQNTLLSLQLEYKQLENKNKLLRIQIEEVNGKLKSKAQEYGKLNQIYRELVDENEDIRKMCNERGVQVDRYRGEAEQNRGQVGLLMMENQKIKKILEQKIAYITDIEIQLSQQTRKSERLEKQYDKQCSTTKQLGTSLGLAQKKVTNLQQLLQSYKAEKIRNRRQGELKWKQMTQFYEKQIQKLNAKLLNSQLKYANSKLSPSRNINLANSQIEYS